MIEIDELFDIDENKMKDIVINDDILKKIILKIQIENLVKQIIKWYNLTSKGKDLAQKYKSLLMKIGKIKP